MNSTRPSGHQATAEEKVRPEYPIWAFILVECLYILLFCVAMAIIHQIGVLKDDDDAVTIHHKLHGDMIEKQEQQFVEEQQEQLAASRN